MMKVMHVFFKKKHTFLALHHFLVLTTKIVNTISGFRNVCQGCFRYYFLGHLSHSGDLLLWVGVRRRASCVVHRPSYVIR